MKLSTETELNLALRLALKQHAACRFYERHPLLSEQASTQSQALQRQSHGIMHHTDVLRILKCAL